MKSVNYLSRLTGYFIDFSLNQSLVITLFTALPT